MAAATSQFDPVKLRAQFPVAARQAYLNAGTDGPLPAAAARAMQEEVAREAEEGRTHAHFERRGELSGELRTVYASILGCAAEDIALTTCTSEGIAVVIDGLRLGRGDEIVTSDEEHPGLLGAVAAAQAVYGVTVKVAPWDGIANAVGPRTKLVACSQVSWMTGRHAPRALAEVSVPVLLDGAQGVGSVPTDVGTLGCGAYAGAGQKWLCGPDGTGMLYVSEELRGRLAVTRRGYGNLADPGAGLQSELHGDARRFDALSVSAETHACAVAAAQVLADAGWEAVHRRASTLAAELARGLTEYGRGLAVPDETEREGATLVSFTSADPEGERERLAAKGVLLRDIPGRPWLRASVGAWNDESDLERLLDALD